MAKAIINYNYEYSFHNNVKQKTDSDKTAGDDGVTFHKNRLKLIVGIHCVENNLPFITTLKCREIIIIDIT